jgi:elongation factor P hydroxylase
MVVSSALLSKQNIIPPILSEDILHGNEEQLVHFHRKVHRKVKYKMRERLKERLKEILEHKRNWTSDA